ncbi:hypothetical protein GN956_G25943 [Arapaima gigas]
MQHFQLNVPVCLLRSPHLPPGDGSPGAKRPAVSVVRVNNAQVIKSEVWTLWTLQTLNWTDSFCSCVKPEW